MKKRSLWSTIIYVAAIILTFWAACLAGTGCVESPAAADGGAVEQGEPSTNQPTCPPCRVSDQPATQTNARAVRSGRPEPPDAAPDRLKVVAIRGHAMAKALVGDMNWTPLHVGMTISCDVHVRTGLNGRLTIESPAGGRLNLHATSSAAIVMPPPISPTAVPQRPMVLLKYGGAHASGGDDFNILRPSHPLANSGFDSAVHTWQPVHSQQ